MYRSCIFASYDAHGIIHDYVVTYLKYLKEVSDEIVFISDCPFESNEIEKIKPYVSYYECKKHYEYDFGSYKRGLIYLLTKGKGRISSDEVILCNDSCFCINSLSNIFEVMDQKKCDVWSVTMSRESVCHLQSFFLVFKNKVINNEQIIEYFTNVEKKDNFYDIVHSYEIPLLGVLKKNGFIGDSFVPPVFSNNPTMYPIDLLNLGMPLIKRKIFTDRTTILQPFFKFVGLIKQQSPSSYKEILKYYSVSCMFQIWFKNYFLKNVKLFSIDEFRSGLVRYRILFIPILYYKKKKKDN